MKKLLENVLPVGAPWGGPESVRFVSCFASLLMHIRPKLLEEPLYCTQDIGLCTGCGRCGPFNTGHRKHEELYHLYLTLSGLGLQTLWREDAEERCFADLPLVYRDDVYMERSMSFAGLSYRVVENTSEGGMQDQIRESIDRGSPVLAYLLANDDWCLLTGYDGEGGVYGRYVRKPWDDRGRLPDSVTEDGIFEKRSWWNPGVRLAVVEGDREPEKDTAALFAALSDTLRGPAACGCKTGFAAYAACLARLSDGSYFEHAQAPSLEADYRMLHRFVGMLAENRCFASFAFLHSLYGRFPVKSSDAMRTVGAYFMDTHNRCWNAWAMMGKNHICRPEQHAQNLRNAEVREKLCEYIGLFRQNDRMAMQLLRDSARMGWL